VPVRVIFPLPADDDPLQLQRVENTFILNHCFIKNKKFYLDKKRKSRYPARQTKGQRSDQ
jgi:hypothetical protein